MDEIYSIKYEIHSLLYENYEKWRTDIEVEIQIFNDRDEYETIGRANLYYFDAVSGFYTGCDHFDLFDLKGETLDYYEELYDSESEQPEIKDEVACLFEDEYCTGNLLIFDRIEILPKHRGQGLTSLLIDNASRIYSKSNDIICLKSYPLQFDCDYKEDRAGEWEKKMEISSFNGEKEESFKNLECYYKKLGFLPVGTTGIMVKQSI